MDNNNTELQNEKNVNVSLRLVISILIAAIFLVADLYIMINLPQNYIALALITVLFLVSIYFILDAVLRMNTDIKERSEEQYDNIYKSEKASYLLLRKSFDDLSEILGQMSKNKNDDFAEDIVNAQKALAKIIISRNAENSDALMNSHDLIIEKLLMLENKIEENENKIKEAIQTDEHKHNQESQEIQERIFMEMSSMEASLKDEILRLSEKLGGFQTEIEALADGFISTLKESIESIPKLVEAATPVVNAVQSADVINMKEVEQSIPVEAGIIPEADSLTETGILTEAEITPETDILAETDITPETDILAEAEITPETDILAEEEITPEIGILTEAEITPETDILAETDITPETDILAEAGIIPETDILAEVEITPETDILAEAGITPETDTFPEVDILGETGNPSEAFLEDSILMEDISLGFDENVGDSLPNEEKSEFEIGEEAEMPADDFLGLSDLGTDQLSLGESITDEEDEDIDLDALLASLDNEITDLMSEKGENSDETNLSNESESAFSESLDFESGFGSDLFGAAEESQIGELSGESEDESLEESVDDSINKLLEESAEDSTSELQEESVEDSINKLLEEPVEESISKLIEEPTEETMNQLLEEPAEESITELLGESTEDTMSQFMDTPVEEPTEEKAEEKAEEPAKEPAPAMPDLSNPHKIMTPDEIAALLANM